MSTSPPASPEKCWRWYHPVLLLLIVLAMVALELRWLKSPELTPEQEKRASVEFNKKPATTEQKTATSEQKTGTTEQPDQQSPDNTVQKKTKAFATTGIRWVWCGQMVLLAAFVLVAGNGITGYWRGAFIDSTNRISLSRFQMIAWTILLVSAY